MISLEKRVSFIEKVLGIESTIEFDSMINDTFALDNSIIEITNKTTEL